MNTLDICLNVCTPNMKECYVHIGIGMNAKGEVKNEQRLMPHKEADTDTRAHEHLLELELVLHKILKQMMQ